jgi:hypothetical protein
MEVLDSLANLEEDDAGDVANIGGAVLLGDVLDNFGIAIVSEVELVPVHNLPQVAEFVHTDNPVTAVHDFVAACDVFMVQSLEDVQLVIEDVEAVCEFSVRGKETMLFEAESRAQLQCEFSFLTPSFNDSSKSASAEL